MSDWTITFYETPSGRRPVQDYLDELDGREARRVIFDLQLLAQHGSALGEPHVKHIRDELWELRTRGSLQHRIIYFTVSGPNREIVLLHAFLKKTDKTPKKHIETAMHRYKEQINRSGDRE